MCSAAKRVIQARITLDGDGAAGGGFWKVVGFSGALKERKDSNKPTRNKQDLFPMRSVNLEAFLQGTLRTVLDGIDVVLPQRPRTGGATAETRPD